MSVNDPDENLFASPKNSQQLQLLLTAIDASISGIIITDNLQPDNPIIYCNKAFENMTGYKRHEIIGHNCRFLQGQDRDQPARALLADAVKKGEALTVEIRNYKKEGALFWNELYMAPVKDEHGKVKNFIGVQNDVTRRKTAEQMVKTQQITLEDRVAERTKSLKENEEYLASIIATVREILVVLNTDLTVRSANEYFFTTFKVNKEETIGKKIYDLGDGQWNIAELRSLLENILPSNNPVIDFEVSAVFPHIGKKIMLLNAYRIEHEGAYKDRILIAIEDITERRAIETRKDDFLSIASHELKTPLTTLKGYLQVLERWLSEKQDSNITNALQKANKSANRLDALISDLLDVSKIQSGNLTVHRNPFEFDAMVKETVDGFQQSNQSHKIELSGTTNKTISGDESSLQQVLQNLLSNAVKYSPDASSVNLHISVVSDYIKCAVSDKGMGISIDDQRRVFDRFYRVKNIQERYPGMGIGLYVCDQIVKQHGGSLWIDSEPGHGATFSFTIPLEDNHQRK